MQRFPLGRICVARIGFGAMQLPGPGVFGPPRDRDQALAVLASLGFSRYDEVGVPFDPTRHEVVNMVDDAEAEPGTVVQVLRPGYGTVERQLRPGAVTVAGRRG